MAQGQGEHRALRYLRRGRDGASEYLLIRHRTKVAWALGACVAFGAALGAVRYDHYLSRCVLREGGRAVVDATVNILAAPNFEASRVGPSLRRGHPLKVMQGPVYAATDAATARIPYWRVRTAYDDYGWVAERAETTGGVVTFLVPVCDK